MSFNFGATIVVFPRGGAEWNLQNGLMAIPAAGNAGGEERLLS